MAQRYSDITIVLDTSGSMQSIRDATVRGINDFIREVNAEPGDGCWTLVQFDDQSSARGAGEEFPKVVFSAVPNGEVPLLEPAHYCPRGGTALVDAVCLTIRRTRERLAAGDPAKDVRVLMVVMTDGQENGSVEFSTEKMRELIAAAQADGWEFIFLGANQDAFAEANRHGIRVGAGYLNTAAARAAGVDPHANVRQYTASTAGAREVYASTAEVAKLWKAHSHPTAESLLSPASPDDPGREIDPENAPGYHP